jgi:hypothetical protein
LNVLFPHEPRDFPYRRSVRAALRALHILTAGTLVGGHIFAQPDQVLMPWLVAATATGVLLLLSDLHASLAIVFEMRGLAMFIKLFLLGLIAFWPDAAVPLLVTVVLIGAISSHLPKYYRHKLLFMRDWVVSDRRSG